MLAILCAFIISNAAVSSFAQVPEPTTDASLTVTPATTTAVPTCPEFCTQPPEPGGRGKAPFRMWYFDTEKHECKRFRYTGRNGNQNKFRKRVDCESNCKNCVLTGSSAEDDEAKSETCSLPQSQGSMCKELSPLLTWYFDSDKRVCQPFVYLGCGGNENRFDSESDCNEACT